MALRIQGLWSNLFGTPRLDATYVNKDAHKERREQQNPQEQSENEQRKQRAKDPNLVKRAAEQLRTHPEFQSKGIQILVEEQKDGIKVSLTDASGLVIKVMSAEEFLRLKEATTEASPRGKILDQKF